MTAPPAQHRGCGSSLKMPRSRPLGSLGTGGMEAVQRKLGVSCFRAFSKWRGSFGFSSNNQKRWFQSQTWPVWMGGNGFESKPPGQTRADEWAAPYGRKRSASKCLGQRAETFFSRKGPPSFFSMSTRGGLRFLLACRCVLTELHSASFSERWVYPKWNPGKWKQGPEPSIPRKLNLTMTQIIPSPVWGF